MCGSDLTVMNEVPTFLHHHPTSLCITYIIATIPVNNESILISSFGGRSVISWMKCMDGSITIHLELDLHNRYEFIVHICVRVSVTVPFHNPLMGQKVYNAPCPFELYFAV